jgi:hypothetical protein
MKLAVLGEKEVSQVSIPITKTCFHREKGRDCSCMIRGLSKGFRRMSGLIKIPELSLDSTEKMTKEEDKF